LTGGAGPIRSTSISSAAAEGDAGLAAADGITLPATGAAAAGAAAAAEEVGPAGVSGSDSQAAAAATSMGYARTSVSAEAGRNDCKAADIFEAQSILLSMCAAEQLLTHEHLVKLRRLLQGLQAAAVQLGSKACLEQQEQQQEQQVLELGLSRFELSKVSFLMPGATPLLW
jgi:hypothetical protein